MIHNILIIKNVNRLKDPDVNKAIETLLLCYILSLNVGIYMIFQYF